MYVFIYLFGTMEKREGSWLGLASCYELTVIKFFSSVRLLTVPKIRKYFG